MRKLLFFLCALLTGVSTMWAQSDPITLTFESNGQMENARNANDVTVTVSGGASATFTVTGLPGSNKGASQTGELLANVSDTIICANANANGNPEFKFNFIINNLPDDFEFNTVGLYIHALDLNGNPQVSTGRLWNISIAADDDEDFASVTDLDIVQTAARMNREIKAEQSKTITGNSLTLTLTITKGSSNPGCFFGLSSITLSNVQTTEVTYHLMYNGTDKATEVVEEQLGAEPALPSSFQRDYCSFTYFYSDEACTQQIEAITAETNDIYVKAEVNTDELPFTLSTDYNSATWYYLHGHSTYANRYISTNDDATVYDDEKGNGMTAEYLWAFLGNPIDGIKLINMASGEDKVLQGDNPATMGTDGKAWILKKQTATNHNYGVGKSFGFYDPELTYLNTQDGTLKYWGSFDQGSTFWVEDPAEVYSELLESLKATTSKFGDELGQYHLTGEYVGQDIQSIISTLESEGYTLENNAKVLALFESVEINMPTEGMFLRFKGSYDKYLADGNSSTGPYNYTTDKDATTIFYFDGSHLVNLSSGKSVGMQNGNSATEGWAWEYGTDNASTVEFSDGGTNGGYNVYIGRNDSYAYLRVNSDEDCVRRGASGTSWSLEEVTTLPITLNDIEYATLCSPVALTIPSSEGVTAYVATGLNGSSITLEAISGTIPADVPVILEGTADKTYNFGITTGGSTPGTILTGTGLGVASIDAESVYTLQNIDGPAFYTYTGTQLPAFKAYLPKTAGSNNVKGFTFDFGTTDGIATVEGATAEGSVIYNLAGQRVEKAVKGVYIVNGKKVLVK